MEKIVCDGCGEECKGYRLILNLLNQKDLIDVRMFASAEDYESHVREKTKTETYDFHDNPECLKIFRQKLPVFLENLTKKKPAEDSE